VRFRRLVIEKEVLAEQVAFDLGQCDFLAGVVLQVPDRTDLSSDDVPLRFLAELETGRGLQAGRQCAHPVVSDDQHRLFGSVPGTVLRADVMGRRQRQAFVVPEARMVPGVLVGFAAQDVEHQSSAQLTQRRLRRGEAVSNDFRKIFVTGVTRQHTATGTTLWRLLACTHPAKSKRAAISKWGDQMN